MIKKLIILIVLAEQSTLPVFGWVTLLTLHKLRNFNNKYIVRQTFTEKLNI